VNNLSSDGANYQDLAEDEGSEDVRGVFVISLSIAVIASNCNVDKSKADGDWGSKKTAQFKKEMVGYYAFFVEAYF